MPILLTLPKSVTVGERATQLALTEPSSLYGEGDRGADSSGCKIYLNKQASCNPIE